MGLYHKEINLDIRNIDKYYEIELFYYLTYSSLRNGCAKLLVVLTI